ncbi:hypothetical protein GCG54_00015662 [Colletotrichum gloeosporioides]|uniref:Uncharacterized protein n=1 Tax=Colletotrichum gloeosporioides TaxID=474922 RepID=A0A8H8WNA2_COLGL|nr:uncharacterized protein GCG54_00015662 [Colletotrichum gloeosporioides]KAF3797018.1 hypothetical protein GCG54_00015662 [Colletotrichum gloeosporioides]
MQMPGERKSRYRRAYLEEAWGSFDAMFPSKYRPGSSKRRFDTIHRRWIHCFYQITKHAEDNGIPLTTLWAAGGWLFEAVTGREPARLTHSILRKVNRSLGIADEYSNARRQSDSSRVDAFVDLQDGSSQISASEVVHSTSFVAEEKIKSESESESESGCYSDSTYDERAHLTLRVTRSSSRPKTPRPYSDMSRPVTSATKVKAESIDSPTADIRNLIPPSPVQTLQSMSRFMSPSPGGSDIQIDTPQHSSSKRRFDQVEASSANQSPDSRLPRRARRRRLTTAGSDQESTSPTQWDRASMSVENTYAREAFNEAFARWSTFATTEKKQNTGDKMRDLGNCEEELRRLEQKLALAQTRHDKTHQQIEAIDKLIAAAAPGQDEGDGIGIERSSGGAWASLLATAERTREVLEGEAQEQVEALSTAVEAMRADVARLTDEAEMQRLVGVVARGMEDLSGLVEKRY